MDRESFFSHPITLFLSSSLPSSSSDVNHDLSCHRDFTWATAPLCASPFSGLRSFRGWIFSRKRADLPPSSLPCAHTFRGHHHRCPDKICRKFSFGWALCKTLICCCLLLLMFGLTPLANQNILIYSMIPILILMCVIIVVYGTIFSWWWGRAQPRVTNPEVPLSVSSS